MREKIEYDIVIVGGGPSGLSAAIKAKQLDANLNVVVLDKRRNAQHQPTDLVHSRSLTLSEYRAGRATLARSAGRLSMISCVLYCYY